MLNPALTNQALIHIFIDSVISEVPLLSMSSGRVYWGVTLVRFS